MLPVFALAPCFITWADTGTTNNLFILSKLDDDLSFVGRANAVTRDGFSELFFGYIDANLRYSLDHNWSVEAGYRQARLKLDSECRDEYRPMFGAIWKDTFTNWRFYNRSRIELRYFEGNANDRIRIRNESSWTSLHKVTDARLTPYVEQEFFFEPSENGYNQNWLTLGFSRNFTKTLKWKLGYRLQSLKFGSDWDNRHLLVTGISYVSK